MALKLLAERFYCWPSPHFKERSLKITVDLALPGKSCLQVGEHGTKFFSIVHMRIELHHHVI